MLYPFSSSLLRFVYRSLLLLVFAYSLDSVTFSLSYSFLLRALTYPLLSKSVVTLQARHLSDCTVRRVSDKPLRKTNCHWATDTLRSPPRLSLSLPSRARGLVCLIWNGLLSCDGLVSLGSVVRDTKGLSLFPFCGCRFCLNRRIVFFDKSFICAALSLT